MTPGTCSDEFTKEGYRLFFQDLDPDAKCHAQALMSH